MCPVDDACPPAATVRMLRSAVACRSCHQPRQPAYMDHAVAAHAEVIAALRAVLPPGIALAGGRIGEATTSPYAVETATLVRAVDKRRREFVAGRHYARMAMSHLGLPAVPIAVLPSRAPDWPQGIAGSISHARDACVAVVAKQSEFVGVGVDIESSTPLSAELYATVCRPAEFVATSLTTGDQAKLLFVVKEAFFKLYHPVTGHFLDFLDVDVRLDLPRGAFRLTLREGAPELRGEHIFTGSCGRAGPYCFAFIALRSC